MGDTAHCLVSHSYVNSTHVALSGGTCLDDSSHRRSMTLELHTNLFQTFPIIVVAHTHFQ